MAHTLRNLLALLLAFAHLHSVICTSRAEQISYAVHAASSAMLRGQGNGLTGPASASSSTPLVSYEHGEFQWALRLLYERDLNGTYFDYIKTGVDNVVSSNGSVGGAYIFSDYSLDPIRAGPSFVYMYQQTKESKYKIAAGLFHSQLMGHPRTAQGQFWHKKRYVQQGWLDGIYMGDVFYATYVKAFQPTNTTAWADIENQFILMYNNTIQLPGAANYTGLLYHGYDYSHAASWASVDRGHSPEVWDRAMGWYMMALVDTLEILPSSPLITAQVRKTLMAQLSTLAPRVISAADTVTGVWWLVVTQPGRSGNYYESSGAAMFVYALLKAVRMGYLSDADGSVVGAARKAYQYLLAHFVSEKADGTMDWTGTVHVGSLDTTGDFQYYISQSVNTNDLKGVAAFVLASLEYERI